MKIVHEGHPALSTRAEEIPTCEDVSYLVSWMQALVCGAGIGLAANQLGKLKRAIIIHTNNFKKVILNPVITKRYGGQIGGTEGCLSLPGLRVMVVRHKQVVVEGFDKNWSPVRFKLKGLEARVVQHEVDHLDGITIRQSQFKKVSGG